MKLIFVLDQPWDSAVIDYAYKIFNEASKKYETYLVGVRNSYLCTKDRSCIPISELRSKNPLRFVVSFFQLYRLFRSIKPDIVVTLWGEATLISCLLKKRFNFKLFRIFGYNKKLKTPANCIDRLILPCEFLKKNVDGKKVGDVYALKSFVYSDVFVFSEYGRQRIREAFNLKNKVVFGAVGRLDEVKGYTLLIDAFAEANIENGVLFVVGEEKGVKRKWLEQRAKEKGVENFILLTNRRNDIIDIMSSFDVGVISSIGSEVIPRVLFEFMSIGLPVVSTNVGCLKEISNEVGFLTVNPDVESLSRALRMAKEMGLKGVNMRKEALKYRVRLPDDLFSL